MSNKLKQIIIGSIRKLLASRGYALQKFDTFPSTRNMDHAFRGIVKRNHSFNTVIDIGASNGRWAHSFTRYFPRCQYLLIEAQPVHAEALKEFVDKHQNAQFVLAAAGDISGKIRFDASNPKIGYPRI